MKTIRVSLPGVDVLEASPDPRDYSLLADDDNILIKEQSRGSESVGTHDTATVAHSLNYLPHFYAYGEISSGRFQLVNGFNPYGDFHSYVDATNLYLGNMMDGTKIMRYFIFYDDIPE